MPYYPKAIINAKFSPESKLPVTDKVPLTWTLPVKVAAPLASIVRRLDPPVTKAISSEAGDIKPVFGSPANFNAQFERGATSSCALKFAGDPNTGIISPASDEIALVTGGSSRLTIDSNGAATFSGNVQVTGALTVTGGFDSGENLALIIALG